MHLFDPKKLEKLDNPQRFQEVSLQTLVRYLQLVPGMNIADLGCGAGLFSFALASLVQPSGAVVGFDIQEESLEYCQNKLKLTPTLGLSFVKGTAEKIPAQGSTFDGALAMLIAHEISNPEVFYAEVFRILKKGSRLLLIDWLPLQTPKGPPLAERLSLEKLSAQLAAAGFKVLQSLQLNENHYLLSAEK